MKSNGAQALIKALEDLGVEQVFGMPGVQNIEIYDALFASGIKHVLVRHEQAAVHMADGYARVTGKVGVVFATSGPGATNTVTGIATAYMDSIPVVVITGQVPTTAIGTDAFQEADITTITLPVTKHSYLIKEVEDLVPSVYEAFYIASSGRPGPVLIDVPGNVASAQTDAVPPKTTPQIPSYKPTLKGNARQIKAAAGLINKAERPVLLVGGGVVSANAAAELAALAELVSIPVATTLLAKGVLPSAHPLNYGQTGVYGAPRANTALQEADVLIAVATKFSERATGNALRFAPEAQVIHIDIDPAEIGKNIRVDIPIVGDAAQVLEALTERLKKEDADKKITPAPSPQCHPEQSEGSFSAHTTEDSSHSLTSTTDTPDNPLRNQSAAEALEHNATYRVFATLNDVLSKQDDVIITTDVGQHQLWASHLLQVEAPRRFITSGGLGTMGYGLPAALGAQIASPRSLVLCVSGDGSYQMCLQEMATARVQNLPVKVVVINNQSLGLVRQWQELFLEERYSHTLLSSVPDYEQLASAYGWEGRRIVVESEPTSEATPSSTTETLYPAFEWLLATEGPALLELVVPQSDLTLPMVKPGGSLTEVI